MMFSYDEKIFTGYRHYDTRKLRPVKYEFGFGLSYTSFKYSNMAVSSRSLRNGDGFTVHFNITNTGSRFGKETAQLYVQDIQSSLPKAMRELKGFVKVSLSPGETKSVAIELDDRAFSHYVCHRKSFLVESGEFIISVGASSRDLRLSESVYFTSSDETREPLGPFNELNDWVSDDRYSDSVKPVFDRIIRESSGGVNDLIGGMPYKTALSFLQVFGISQTSLDDLKREIEQYL